MGQSRSREQSIDFIDPNNCLCHHVGDLTVVNNPYARIYGNNISRDPVTININCTIAGKDYNLPIIARSKKLTDGPKHRRRVLEIDVPNLPIKITEDTIVRLSLAHQTCSLDYIYIYWLDA